LNIGGDAVLPNLGDGVRIASSSSNVIGGTAAGARNVISGNGAVGVNILGPNSVANLIQGNYIGTDQTGTVDLGNSLEGVYINGGSSTMIGGSLVSARNTISGNLHGVGMNDVGAANNVVQGNFIGLNSAGTGAVPNTFDGVRIGGGANQNTVGGQAGARNTIAYNAGDGVFLDATAGTGNTIDMNQIFSNGGMAIDIFPDGVNANDPEDPDAGPNKMQNFPVLTSAGSTLSGTTVAGTLNSNPGGTFTIQVFSDAGCDASGNGEAQLFVGSITVNTDGAGNASFNQLFPVVVAGAHVVSATATDAEGNTSELSSCQAVTGPPLPTLKQGDVDCSGGVNAIDSLLVLRHASGLPVTQNEPCPDIGTVITQTIGDVDCSGLVNSIDALKILRFSAALTNTQIEPCTDIGLPFE
jgi:titin